MKTETMEETIIAKKKCKRCNYTWIPRQEKEPIFCPKCRSPYWNIDRIYNKKHKKQKKTGEKKHLGKKKEQKKE